MLDDRSYGSHLSLASTLYEPELEFPNSIAHVRELVSSSLLHILLAWGSDEYFMIYEHSKVRTVCSRKRTIQRYCSPSCSQKRRQESGKAL
jgi:hypothetical protein